MCKDGCRSARIGGWSTPGPGILFKTSRRGLYISSRLHQPRPLPSILDANFDFVPFRPIHPNIGITMQALRAHSRTSGLKLEETEIPKLGPSDVLVKVVSAGISPGVIKMIQTGKARVPSTARQEVAGTIESMGSGDSGSGLKVGDSVRLHANLACRACLHCDAGQDSTCAKVALVGFSNFGIESEIYDHYHNGGLAEFVRAPHYLVDKLPDCVLFEVGAKVHDLATASRALKLADLRKASTIVLTAPTGAMGVLTLRLADICSVKHVILVGRSKRTARAGSIPHPSQDVGSGSRTI